jgi:hypothetical protein
MAPAGHAVLFKSTGDPTYNTTEPGGALTNSGWRWEGTWSTFLGTPIAPTYFISAAHFGGSTNWTFSLNGFVYHPVASFDDPNSDLIIWKVAETFPSYALLYTNTDEVGKHCVVFGRGVQRGPPVIVSGVTNGWAWGAGDGLKRWGENNVTAIANLGGGVGDTLRQTFDRAGNSNECHLTVNDSGGALFIQDGSVWKLAGIHYAVDNPFISTNGVNGSGFNAAMLDYGGVYIGGDGNWQLITNQVADIPASFYSTRISSRVAWINSVIDFLPGNDLQITAIQKAGNDVLVSFATGTNKTYQLETRDSLTTGSWSVLASNIVGTGGVMIYTNAGAANATNRFYRLGLMP